MTDNTSLPEADRAEVERLQARLKLLDAVTGVGVFATAAASLVGLAAPVVFPVVGVLSAAGVIVGRMLLATNREKLNRRIEALEKSGNISHADLEKLKSTVTRLSTTGPVE